MGRILRDAGFEDRIVPAHWHHLWSMRRHVQIAAGGILEITIANEYIRIYRPMLGAPRRRPYALYHLVSREYPARPKTVFLGYAKEPEYWSAAALDQFIDRQSKRELNMVGSVASDVRSEELYRRRYVPSAHSEAEGKASVKANHARGLRLGIGRSTSLGWFRIDEFDRENRRAKSSTFVMSCTPEERDYVHGQVMKQTGCKADENSGDDIHNVIEIVPCLTS